jgi:hypothetical protein
MPQMLHASKKTVPKALLFASYLVNVITWCRMGDGVERSVPALHEGILIEFSWRDLRKLRRGSVSRFS